MSLPAQGMSLKAKNLSPKAESEPVGRSESKNKQPEPEPASREWEPESRRYGIESHVSAVSLLESREEHYIKAIIVMVTTPLKVTAKDTRLRAENVSLPSKCLSLSAMQTSVLSR